MVKIIGVRFKPTGKIYYFDPVDFDLEVPMHVIVETARGVEMGTVLIPPKEVEDDKVVQPLKPVITTILSRGISKSIFFKLCSRAPRMDNVSLAIVFHLCVYCCSNSRIRSRK